jgi:hypothetical protein
VRGEDAPLYRRVERQVPKLARRMIAQFVEEIPLYGLLPREQLEGEITAITEDNLRVFFRSLRQDRAPTDEELGEIRLSAARRAEPCSRRTTSADAWAGRRWWRPRRRPTPTR